MFSRFVKLSAAAPLVLLAGAAAAAPITIMDRVASGAVSSGGSTAPYNWGQHENGFEAYTQTITSGPAWAMGQTFQFGDIIGDPNKYDAYSLTIDRGPTSISFQLKTKFDGEENPARSTDFMISTQNTSTPDGFNYAVVLGSGTIAGIGAGTAGTRGTLARGFYALTGGTSTTNAPSSSVITSRQAWAGNPGYGMGGLIQFCEDVPSDPGICDATASNGFAVEPAVLAASGTKIGDVSVTRTTDGTWYYLTAVVTGVNMSLFDQFDILVGSADCANDALWGEVQTVPVPGALFLLGFGLLGLGAVRRRAA
jgi:hypothetical protein